MKPAAGGFVARSIPAGAGEPEHDSFLLVFVTVYPRGCGGTLCTRLWVLTGKGLSPRVRGNQETEEGYLYERRSIPAGAGEPARS